MTSKAVMQSIGSPLMWSLFAAFVLVALLVDFFAMSKQGAHRVSTREAAIWSLVWVGVSFVFMGWLWWYLGGAGTDEAAREVANAKSLEFLTGYLIEKALAVDNIFVFLMLFTYFAVPAEFQKRVLMIGILGALVLRAVMILVGAWLIAQFHWILYLFGAFLLFTGIKMWWAAGQEPDLDNNPALKWIRSRFKIAPRLRRREVLHRGGWRQDGHAAAGGDPADRHRRHRVRGRFDPGHLRHHHRPVHRAHVQRVRHPGPARDVLPAGQHARALPPAQLRPGDRPGVHRREDAADRRLQDPGGVLARLHRGHAGGDDDPVAQDPAQGHGRAAPTRSAPRKEEA
jgi:hypothetical protein